LKRVILFLILFSICKAEAQSSALVIADSLYATGNYNKAINYYAKEGSQSAGLQIARAYHSIGNYTKAITQYESLVDKAPDVLIARFELGKLYFKTKRFDDGRKLFTKLVDIDAENPEYLYYLAECFRELDQPASSLTYYKKAVTADSTHLKSLFQLGKYFVVNRETNQALEYLNKGLEFYADDVSLINLKGLAHFNNDAYEKALPLFEILLDLGEKKEFVYTKLAFCYFKAWEFEKAKSTYKRLIEMDVDNHLAYYNLAQVFFKDRQIDSAKFYVRKSIEVQEVTFEKEYMSLAYMYRSEDQLKTALKYYKLAFEEDPTNFRNYYQLCSMIDQTSTDLELKLKYYQNFIEKFGSNIPYMSDRSRKRISELKEEIHFAKK
jgi:tetratricopeptide (TPR) repeat protein